MSENMKEDILVTNILVIQWIINNIPRFKLGFFPIISEI